MAVMCDRTCRDIFIVSLVLMGHPIAGAAPLEEVLVTARKRAERVQDVPISMSVRTGVELEERNAYRVQEMIQSIPNVAADIQNPRQASISIRGLGKNPASDGLEASVGVFLDGVFLGRPGMVVTDLIDLERFEVLRGPQGTLFGKNTTAGALHITTRAPGDEREGWFEVTGGNQDFLQLKGAFAGPIVRDLLTFRLNAFDTSRRGFIDATTRGEDLGEFDRSGARGQLLWSPSESVKVRLIADYSSQDEDGPGFLLVDPAIYLADGSVRPNNLLERAARVGYAPSADPFARRTDSEGTQRASGEQSGVSVQAEMPVGRYSLTSISAWRRWNFTPRGDGDFTALVIQPELGVSVRDRQFTQELRVTSPAGGSIDYVAGAYFFSQRISSLSNTLYGPDAADFSQPGLPARALDGFRVVTRADPETRSHALFGQGTWRPGDALAVTAGLRWTSENRNADIARTNSGGAALAPAETAARAARERLGGNSSSHVDTSEEFVSALFSVSLRVLDDAMVYVSAAHGAKSGGINVTAVPAGIDQEIDPETATSYELGFKSQWLARRLRLNVGTFWTDVEDFQATGRDPLRGVNFLTNAATVRSRGVELESVYQPTTDLTMTLAGGWHDASYTSFGNAPCPAEAVNSQTCDLTGIRVVGVPPWTAHAGVEYAFPVGASRYRGDIGAEYFRSGGYNGDSSRYTRIDGFGLAHLRVGIEPRDWPWRLSLWGRNLLGEDYFTSVFSGGSFNTGAAIGLTGDPRTYGLSFRVNL